MKTTIKTFIGATAAVALTGLVACGGDDPAQPDPDAGVQEETVNIQFAAMFGTEVAQCGVEYAGQGTAGDSAEILDLRFYVSNVRLLVGNEEVPVALTPDGTFQSDRVALLDFEDGSAGCANGTAETNTQIVGTVPVGDYDGVVFDVAVPFDLNHEDVIASEPPLNVTAMYWAWAIGHKFIRVDLDVNDGTPWNVHLGSIMCASGGMTEPPTEECVRPNRPTISLAGFDPDTDTVVFDLAELLADSDLTANVMGPPGCQSFPDDEAECTALFPNLGMDYLQGACVNGCRDQSAFKVQAGAAVTTVTETFALADGQFAEGEFVLEAGTTVRGQFSSSAALEWNVHTHDGGDVQILVEGTAANDAFEFTAPESGTYWSFWRNRSGDAVTLEVTLELGAGAVFNGWL